MTKSSSALAAPDYLTVADYDVTLGPEVAECSAIAGFQPYPEQRLILDNVFALSRDNPNRSAVAAGAVICTRQQMKTGVLKQIALGWLYVMPQELVIWSAHEFGTAQESFADIVALISSSDDLSRRVRRIRTAAGSESIEMMDGSRLKFKARTSGGGRGLSGSKVILDEGYALLAPMMGALLPTMIAKPDPQVLYASSAGMAKSDVLRGVRDRGRAGAPGLFYAEWGSPKVECADRACDHKFASCPPGCALDDLDNWRKACPISARKDWEHMTAIANLRRELPPEEFMRECLGWWDEPLGDAAISPAQWSAELDRDSRCLDPHFAVDVSPDRAWAAIVVAGRNGDGKMHVEITSKEGRFDHRTGTDWIVPRLREILKSRGSLKVHYGAGSAVESLVPDMQSAGVQPVRIAAGDVTAACGRFYDLAMSTALAHPEQDDLTSAVLGARQKWLGERAFVWVREGSTGDITPMYAATLAAWVADSARDPAMNVW